MTSAPPWQWPADVVAYAATFNLAQYLEPLRELTLRLFPTAVSFRAYLDPDPEIRDLTFLIFEVIVPECDIPNWLQAKHLWDDEAYRILPRPYQCPLVLDLGTTKQ